MNAHRIWATVVVVGVTAVLAIAVLVGVTTHESHLREIDRHDEQMQACIASNRSAMQCQYMVYGSQP